MKRILFLLDDSNQQENFAWAIELATLTHCILLVAWLKNNFLNEAIVSQRIASFIQFHHQHWHEQEVLQQLSDPPEKGAALESEIVPEISYADLDFCNVQSLVAQDDVLIIPLPVFQTYASIRQLTHSSTATIILPEHIHSEKLDHLQTGKFQQEKARLFYQVLRKASKHQIPKEFYDKLGQDTRLFNLITAYIRKNFHKKK